MSSTPILRRALTVALVLLAGLSARAAHAEVCAEGLCAAVPEGYARGQYGAVAGVAPGPAHLRGTLVLGYAHTSGVRLVEWDVATARVSRIASLGGAAGVETDVAVTRRPGGFAVLTTPRRGAQAAHLFLVDDAFRVTASRRLDAGHDPAIGFGGDTLAVAWLTGNDRLSVARFDPNDASARARSEVKLPGPAAMVPGVSLVVTQEHVFAGLKLEPTFVLVEASPSLVSVTVSPRDVTEGTLALDGDVPHLLTRDREGAIVDGVLHGDLSLGEARVVDHTPNDIGLAVAFGREHVLALPSGALVSAGLAGVGSRRAVSGKLVQRLVWVGERVVSVDSSWKVPTMVITREE